MLMIRKSEVKKGSGRLDPSRIDRFRADLHGELLAQGDVGYDAVRCLWNGLIDKHPALIACCADVADVTTAVEFAHQAQLLVAIRSGGHSIAGHGMCDGGLVIDVSRMKDIHVDSAACIARAEAGVTTGEFLRATEPFGLAVPAPPHSGIGLSGLTLGGGFGWLSGKYGMTCDNLLAADVVTVEGELLTANRINNADLFWALRGGGGNFGVVTGFEFQLHPAAQLLAGMLIHPLARTRDVLRFYGEYTRSCPDELTIDVAILTAPDGSPVVGFLLCYCGSYSDGENVLAPLRSFGPPLADLVRTKTISEAHSLVDPFSSKGSKYYFKAYSLSSLADPVIDLIAQHGARRTSPFSAIVLRHFHGAGTRVAQDATAVGLRDEHYILEVIARWKEGEAKPHIDWAQRFCAAVKPFASQGLLINSLGDEGDERVRASFGANYERLVQVKERYDPTNFFHLNQNIPPTSLETIGRKDALE